MTHIPQLKQLRWSHFLNATYWIILLLILAYCLYVGASNVLRYTLFQNEYSQLYRRHSALKSELYRYQQQLNAMATDDYWELEARKRLGYIRKGERVYKYVHPLHHKSLSD